MTTGRGMARIQGVPDFPIATLVHKGGNVTGMRDSEEIENLARQAAPQVERIPLGSAGRA